jgi:hypothetical protein
VERSDRQGVAHKPCLLTEALPIPVLQCVSPLDNVRECVRNQESKRSMKLLRTYNAMKQ